MSTVLRRSAGAAFALLALALLVYVWGLGGQNIPRNGDEMVYAHIARLTAASGHWLPLVSQLDHMRNTKPPLLFWQALVATQWGSNWQLWALRLPSLLYTLGSAALCFAMAWRVGRSAAKGALAAAIYLAFLSSFRYGRPYLTSAAESFWLNLPMWWLAWRCLRPAPPGDGRLSDAPAGFAPGWGLSLLLGIAVGLGAAYKSFALIVPACAALWVALLWLQGPRWPQWGRASLLQAARTTAQVALIACVALAVFSLWFVLDPDPAAVWREFVVGENAGKMGSSSGYWATALRGSSSIWVQALAYMVNAGLLAFLVPGLLLVGLGLGRKGTPYMRTQLLNNEQPLPAAWRKTMLAWLLVWLVIFCLPSTRSARYVIAAMPALALLLALCWERIGRLWFAATLLVASVCLLVLGRIAWVMAELGIGSMGSTSASLLVFGLAIACLLLALLKPAAMRPATLGLCLLVFACFNATVAPLDGPAGRFGSSAAQQLRGQRIAVPSGFNGQFERYEFLLPGNRILPYTALDAGSATAALPSLLASADLLVWSEQQGLPAPCAAGECRVIDSRWDTEGRQPSGSLSWAKLWQPQQWLLRREWLIQP